MSRAGRTLNWIARAGLAGLCAALIALPRPGLADDPPWQDAPPAPGRPTAPPDQPAPPDDPGLPPQAASPADAAPPEPAPAIDPEDAPKCIVTGERWDTSSTRVEAIFKVDGMKQRGKFLGLPFMLIQYKALKAEHHEVELLQVRVLDYATFGTGAERMVLINDDWNNVVFLRTGKKLAGSRAPYFAAFTDADELGKAKKDLGGKAMDYKTALSQIFGALNAPDDPDAPRKGGKVKGK